MEKVTEALAITIIGMGVVLCALLALQLAVALIRGVDYMVHSLRPQGGHRPAGDEEISDEEVAVITAAVTSTFKRPVTIHHIRMLPESAQDSWSRLGRIDIMRSHTRGPDSSKSS